MCFLAAQSPLKCYAKKIDNMPNKDYILLEFLELKKPQVKKIFGSFALCLMATTHALSSMGEEEFPRPTSVTGHKRPHAQEGRTGASTPKVQRVNPDTKETSTQELSTPSCLVKLLPYEILTEIAAYLTNEELLHFASTDQDLRALLLPAYFTKNSPTRAWTSALVFGPDLQGRKDHFTFVAKIMPKLMHAVLTMYRCQTPAHVTYFHHLLEEHGTFSTQGRALQETPLWQFLMTLEGADLKSLPFDSPFSSGEAGDGDHVFFNMLHYIKNNFEHDPTTLPFYTAPRIFGRRSLQEGMHEAHALIAHARAQNDYAARAQTWDQILTTCTILKTSELRTAVLHYTQAEHATSDEGAKYTLLTKSMDMWDAYLKSMPRPDSQTLQLAASTFQKASSPLLGRDMQKTYMEKSVSLWEAFLAQAPNPSANIISMVANAHTNLSYLEADAAKKIRLLRTGTALWERCTHPLNNPQPLALSQAAAAYSSLGAHTSHQGERASAFLKSASLCARHLNQVENPPLADFSIAATTYTLAALYAINPTTATTFHLESAHLWDRYLVHTPAPTAIELYGAMSSYLNASKHSRNGPAKKVPLDKCVTLYNEYLRQGNLPTQQLQEKMNEVMAQMALCNPERQARRAQRPDAATKKMPPKS
ncbi:MAG: hypothetical protein C0514_09245 [Candidatus Puniceispirillum sp.]|nr:hypothetical protein [Candidatus Puniceispirillum sp.]